MLDSPHSLGGWRPHSRPCQRFGHTVGSASPEKRRCCEICFEIAVPTGSCALPPPTTPKIATSISSTPRAHSLSSPRPAPTPELTGFPAGRG